MKYTKEEARRIILNCAKQYQDKLLDKKMIVIYRDRTDKALRYIEVVFYDRNYQHLTGVELVDAAGKVIKGQSVNFFRKCITNKLSLKEIALKKDGTTNLKLVALPALMSITKITKITGEYNNIRPYLYVDKVMGGVNFCLGLSRDGNEYVPSSALQEDIKKLTDAPAQVLTIMEKNIEDEIYSIVKHVAKGLNLNNLKLPDEIIKKVSLENYTYIGK